MTMLAYCFGILDWFRLEWCDVNFAALARLLMQSALSCMPHRVASTHVHMNNHCITTACIKSQQVKTVLQGCPTIRQYGTIQESMLQNSTK